MRKSSAARCRWAGGFIDPGSVWRGLRVMRHPFRGVNYKVGRCEGFFFSAWTPIWHEGRGPYICIGLGYIGFWRGY